MTTFLRRRQATTQTIPGMLFSASFMILWLCFWPFYRMVRSIQSEN